MWNVLERQSLIMIENCTLEFSCKRMLSRTISVQCYEHKKDYCVFRSLTLVPSLATLVCGPPPPQWYEATTENQNSPLAVWEWGEMTYPLSGLWCYYVGIQVVLNVIFDLKYFQFMMVLCGYNSIISWG